MKTKIGFIGTGNMAKAIMSMAKQKGAKNILAFDINADALKNVSDYSKVAKDNQAVVNDSKVIFICVKPQFASEVFSNLMISDNKILVSIMAGISLEKLTVLSNAKKIVRVMPNMHASVGMSFNAYCFTGISDKEKTEIHNVLKLFGLPRAIEEKHMDAITGISGSSPAFVYKFAAGLLSAAKAEGLPAEHAIVAILGVLGGSGMHLSMELVDAVAKKSYDEAAAKIAALVNSVCSKGGTTIEGVNYLNNSNFETVVQNSAVYSINKSKDMAALLDASIQAADLPISQQEIRK